MIDKSIIKASIGNEKIMNYYFDKFNVKLKDINPFANNVTTDLDKSKSLRIGNDDYSLTKRNLQRMLLSR